MEEQNFGTRDKRGFWKPNELIGYGPLLAFPIRILKILSLSLIHI